MFSLISGRGGNVVVMSTITPSQQDQQHDVSSRRVGADAMLGLGLLAVVILGKLVWALSDGSLLSALGAR